MNKVIWGNTIVKNEGRYIWFAIMSVLPYLDKILIYDTGSNDDTLKIIKDIKKKFPAKVSFKEVGEVDKVEISKLRQQMLSETKSDWFLIIDGDEVWWKDSIKKIVSEINKNNNLDAIVIPTINLIGDIYHYQEEAAGGYRILGRTGHLNIRAINRNIPGLYVKGIYPLEGYYNKNNKLVQDEENKRIKFIDAPILHFTHLPRASFTDSDLKVVERDKKKKYELGESFPNNFKYPEIFYENYPNIIMSPWKRMSKPFWVRALIETPLKKIKRRFIKL